MRALKLVCILSILVPALAAGDDRPWRDRPRGFGGPIVLNPDDRAES